jgi:hypothetical protein
MKKPNIKGKAEEENCSNMKIVQNSKTVQVKKSYLKKLFILENFQI